MGFMSLSDPNKSSTIEEFISFKDDDSFSYNNLSFRDKYDNIIYPIKNIIDDYMEELMQLTIDVELSETEYIKYRYKPRLLANDIYNNPDIDFILLAINGICNMKEFNFRKLRLIKIDDLNDFLTDIYNANKEFLDLYNAENAFL